MHIVHCTYNTVHYTFYINNKLMSGLVRGGVWPQSQTCYEAKHQLVSQATEWVTTPGLMTNPHHISVF